MNGKMEPIHGLAFDITGKGIANSVATFWTAAMMLERPGEKPAADHLMKGLERVTADKSPHTPDLGGKATANRVTEQCAKLYGARTIRKRLGIGGDQGPVHPGKPCSRLTVPIGLA